MIEKTFLDRVPTNPGRVILTPVPGQANTYDMVRADSPLVVGTPLDKAAIDSIIQSRLTGRYYAPTVAREVLSYTAGQSDPVPSSGWVEDSYSEMTNGTIKITSSYPDYPNLPDHAFDSSSSSYWAAESDSGETWIAVDFGTKILVNKLIVQWFSYDYDYFRVSFQGSNDGTTWTEIAKTTGNRESATEWSFPNSTEYSQYRLVFTQGTENSMRLYEWGFVGWSVSTYKNSFVVENGFPSEWTTGQRVTIQTPAVVNTVGILANTLNGVKIDTILLPNRRYELRYTGSMFAAKEV